MQLTPPPFFLEEVPRDFPTALPFWYQQEYSPGIIRKWRECAGNVLKKRDWVS